jgi:hypothetical protein
VPASIKDETNHYEIKLNGTGTADVTLRRLQQFVVRPGKVFVYWLNEKTGNGVQVIADSSGALTIPAVAVQGSLTLIIEPTDATPIKAPAKKIRPNQGHYKGDRLRQGVATLSRKTEDAVDAMGRPAPDFKPH